MRAVVLVLALGLLTLPPFAQAGAAPVSVVGPDPEGAFLLTFDVTRTSPGNAVLALDITHAGTRAAARELGSVAFAAGTTRWNTSFLPSDGSGTYAVRLMVDGEPSDALLFDVASDGSTRMLAFSVPDEPTFLNLTGDTVNADGKLKSPGDEVVTRATLSDGNGVGDVDGVAFRVERGAWSDAGTVAFTAPATNTSAALEHRYARSPLAAGTYRLTLLAMRNGTAVASASRTFVIRDVATSMANATPLSFIPDVNVSQRVDIILSDRNEPPAPPELRVHKGSSRVEAQGFRATLGTARALPDADGAARVAFPMLIEVPSGAAPGAYRVSAYANGSLLGAVALDVLPLPSITSVGVQPANGSLSLLVNLSSRGILHAELTDGQGGTTMTTLDAPVGTSNITLAAPDRAGPMQWSVALSARENGRVLDARNGSWSRAMPTLRLTNAHVTGRLPASWDVDAPGWDLSEATPEINVTRWDGVTAALDASYHHGVVRVEGPPTTEAGRYTAHLRLTMPNGTSASFSWDFDAAPWLRVTLGDASVDGRVARVPLANSGGVPMARLVVEVDAAGNVTLEIGTSVVTARAGGSPGRWVLDTALPPAGNATLVVRLPDGPQRSGAHAASLRVLALAEAHP